METETNNCQDMVKRMEKLQTKELENVEKKYEEQIETLKRKPRSLKEENGGLNLEIVSIKEKHRKLIEEDSKLRTTIDNERKEQKAKGQTNSCKRRLKSKR